MKTLTIKIAFISCFIPISIFSQLPRTDAFHEKYRLKEVVVMSRHNLRTPLSTIGSPINRVTPYKWKNWTAKAGELSLRGGVLETAMGQFFRQWVVNEKLLPDNYIPTSNEIFFYTNSLQRTFATGKYFSAGFLPYANINIHRKYNESKMDPIFTPKFTKMSPAYKARVLRQMNALGGGDKGYLGIMDKHKTQLELMATVVDLPHSPACLEGDTCEFYFDDTTIKIEIDDEPRMRGGYSLANSVADALILQYYETDDSIAAAFGNKLNYEQWRQFGEIKSVYDNILFTTPLAAVNLSYPLISLIREELNKSNRKFVFLCGHDSNLASLRGALNMQIPEIRNSIELHTPIGSKLVFEKWSDGNNYYIAVNLVYQSLDQLKNKKELSPSTPPMIYPVKFPDLKCNADGLYPLLDFDAHLANKMRTYENIK